MVPGPDSLGRQTGPKEQCLDPSGRLRYHLDSRCGWGL